MEAPSPYEVDGVLFIFRLTPQMALAAGDVKITVDESVTVGSIQSQPTKSEVIDQELNRHGMGSYQWCAPFSL